MMSNGVEKIIGVIYRHGYNDYEFTLGDFPTEMADSIESMVMNFDDGYNISGCRGDRNMTLADANIAHFEKEWKWSNITEDVKKRIINNMEDLYYDKYREIVPDEEGIWELLEESPIEVIYNLLEALKDKEKHYDE